MFSYLLKKLFWHNLNNFSTKIALDFAKTQHIHKKITPDISGSTKAKKDLEISKISLPLQ
jgi:hypothetical protein